MLPESKIDFPKCLCLDQNKWIDLARAHYGKPGGEPFQEALQAVKAATKAGSLVVPLSVVNIVEAKAHPNAERRERLARFMVDLSNNVTIPPSMTIFPWEVINALRSLFTNRQLIHIRSSIVKEGLTRAFGKEARIAGVSPEQEVSLLETIHSPETSVELLIAAGDKRDLTEQARAGFAVTTAVCERVRAWAAAGLTTKQRRGVELATLFSQGETGKALVNGLQQTGISLQMFRERLATAADFDRFVSTLPTLDVTLELTLARDQDLVRSIQPNDISDLEWLSVSVPYSNVVVSENFWGHMVKACGLSTRYDTALLTDLRDVPDQLSKLGCV